MMKKHIKIGCLFLLLGSCQEIKSNFELPILGRSKIVTKEVNGLITKDTIPHRIADFKFVNQDSTIEPMLLLKIKSMSLIFSSSIVLPFVLK